MLSKMILSVLSLFPVLAFSAPSPASHQIVLSPEDHESHGIPKNLFDDFNDLAKIVDITNCLQSTEGISYPFECNSFCREFPELKLLKKWNTADDLGDSYGYIAISHEKGKERIIVAFAGDYSLLNAITDLSVTPEDYTPLSSGISSALEYCPGCKVHGDFHREWLKTQGIIEATMNELVTKYILAEENPYQLVLAGHKLGGAVATLAAVDFEARGWNPQVTTFGQPKVGNEAFTAYLTGKFTPSTYRRVTHISDPVPLFPFQGLGFSHYEHEYFISKEFAPYTVADVQICHGDFDCAARVNNKNVLDFDWEASDYFHHADSCIRESTSFFSFATSLFIIELEDPELEKRSTLESAEEVLEDTGEYSAIEHEKAQSLSQNSKQKRDVHVDANAKLVKPIPDSKFAKTFAMVEPPPRKAPPEYEDEELYNAMSGFDKAQGMWIKKPQKAPVTEMGKRSIKTESDTNVAKVVPDSKFKKTFAMVEPPEPEPEEEVYVPEYEDEEIYNSMRGFETAQSMWIKPKEEKEKEKRGLYYGPMTGNMPSMKANDKVYEDIDDMEYTPGEVRIMRVKAPVKAPVKESSQTMLNIPELRGVRKPQADSVVEDIIEPEDVVELEEFPDSTTTEIEVSAYEDAPAIDDTPKVEDASSETEIEVNILKGRGIDRALKFFHAPKEVLNAQLAANDEAAAYEAYQKAQKAPNNSPDTVPDEPNPDEDYVKKGGSVLILNGRPLEVDGRPVRNQIKRRSNGHRPGINRSNGPRKGGLKRGGGDKVTELSSSSPPTTKSNSVVGVIENAVPNSFEEEVVNVQKGGNFVLMNGRRMPANFAQKSVSTKPTKRSYIPKDVGERLHSQEEHVFDPEQHIHKPEINPFHGFQVNSRASKDHISSAQENSQESENYLNSRESFPAFERYLPTPEQNFQQHEIVYPTHEDEYSPFEDVSLESLHLYHPEGSVATPYQRHYQPEWGFYPTEDSKFAVSEQYFHESGHFDQPEDRFAIPKGNFRQPEEIFYPTEDRFIAIPEHRLSAPEGHFHIPPESYCPEEGFYYPEEQSCIRKKKHSHDFEGQFPRDERPGLPEEMQYFSTEKGFEKHFHAPEEHAYIPEEYNEIPSQWEMWEIQQSHTGPLTHTWKDTRENYEAYSGEHPSEALKKEYLYNYE